MNNSPIKIRDLILTLLFSSIIIVCIFFLSYFDTQTKIVFCDVGQGDAAYIRIKNRVDILIDTGPDKKILNCLGRYMPFYDRKIELVIISHGQKDHIGGLKEIMNRYRVEKIITTKSASPGTGLYLASQGDALRVYGDKIMIFWPPKSAVVSNMNENEQSLVFLFQENQFKILFTGDATADVLDYLCAGNKHACSLLQNVNILKIPHHGSKNGLSREFLKLANAGIAVISVGAKNTYGHPAAEVLSALQALKIKIKRTDKDGDIVFRL